MSANEYVLVWTVYVISALIVLAFWCWMTSPLKSLTLRLLLRLPALALALTPVHHVLDETLFAPAVAGIAMEFIAGGEMAASSYIMVLLATLISSILLALVLGFIGRLIENAEQKQVAEQTT
jgi:putative effector of murein hydrolase LrgA (UPF0299 family)